jgi:hypothetical protein
VLAGLLACETSIRAASRRSHASPSSQGWACRARAWTSPAQLEFLSGTIIALVDGEGMTRLTGNVTVPSVSGL